MIAKHGQNIIDVAVQNFGTIENIFDMLQDNNLSLNSELKSGQFILAKTEGKGDNSVKNYVLLKNYSFNNAQFKVATGDYNTDFNNDYLNG